MHKTSPLSILKAPFAVIVDIVIKNNEKLTFPSISVRG